MFIPTSKIQYIVGIDEAGRGPLAGPVSVGAIIIKAPLKHKLFRKVRNSKQLSFIQREEWFSKILTEQKKGSLDYAVSCVSHKSIDEKGIVKAIRLAVNRTLNKLGVDPRSTMILLDGSLKAPDYFLFQETIIRGDETIPLISLASIAAKVVRDRKMIRLAKHYPEFDFDRHKGYGTRIHKTKIKLLGPCEIHRKSFLTRILPNIDKY